eukprot:5529144-Prymnesium_polylepis.1
MPSCSATSSIPGPSGRDVMKMPSCCRPSTTTPCVAHHSRLASRATASTPCSRCDFNVRAARAGRCGAAAVV